MNKCLKRVDDRHFWTPGVFSYAMIPRCQPNSKNFSLIVTSIVYAPFGPENPAVGREGVHIQLHSFPLPIQGRKFAELLIGHEIHLDAFLLRIRVLWFSGALLEKSV
jgi:hypothetical protein